MRKCRKRDRPRKNLLLEVDEDGSIVEVEDDPKYDDDVEEEYITSDQEELFVLR